MSARRGRDERDATRGRSSAILALASAAAATIPIALGGGGAPRAREASWPHATAGIGCGGCHDAPNGAAASCTSCHASRAHEVRAAHRAIVRGGAMGCTSCHAVHEGARGVAFDGAGAALLWSTGREAVVVPDGGRADLDGLAVPVVGASRCAACHDLGRTSDPIARCLPGRGQGGDVAISCLDEHGPSRSAGGEAGRCRQQHVPLAEVAKVRARALADVAPASPPPPFAGGGAPALAGGAAASTAALLLWSRRKRRSPAVAPPRVEERRRLPTIDPSTCLGCRACVDACPFDVLAVRGFVAEVARPEACCGVVLCADVCPNGSLRIEEGDPVLDRPRTDARLESADVPGLYLAGDLTGLPLIKNAIAQGTLAAESVAAERGRPKRREGMVDLLVVGAGPAGLSAGLRAQELGLEVVVVEQATLAASIKGFPREKIVHDPPIHLPAVGPLWLEESTREELLAEWTRIVRTHRLDLREGLRLTDLRREGDAFVADLVREDGEPFAVRAARVVLATGRRGTPRTLELALQNGAESRVFHALSDAARFAGRRVVVAGLGDAAMEAAVALAAQPGTTVTVSYRGDGFTRGKRRNIEALERLVRAGRVRIAFGTLPCALDGRRLSLTRVRGEGPAEETLEADALFVLLGGEPAWGLLTRVGIVRGPGEPDPSPPPAVEDAVRATARNVP